MQTIGLLPAQVPLWQVSVWVQASPSAHTVPSGFGGAVHVPVVGLQMPPSTQADGPAQTIGFALPVEGALLFGVDDVRAFVLAESPLVERALGEPPHRAAVLLVDHDRVGGQPATVGEPDEDGDEEATERPTEGDPADHLGDGRDHLRCIHTDTVANRMPRSGRAVGPSAMHAAGVASLAWTA